MEIKEKEKRRRKELTLKEKYELVVRYENEKISGRKLAEMFNIGHSQASSILKRSQDVKRAFLFCYDGETKRLRNCFPTEQLNEVVFNWYMSMKQNNMPVTGPALQEKAIEVSKQIGVQNFKASNGWLESFKRRHSIRFKPITGDAPPRKKTRFENFLSAIENCVMGDGSEQNTTNFPKMICGTDDSTTQPGNESMFQHSLNENQPSNSWNMGFNDHMTADYSTEPIFIETDDWNRALPEIVNGYSPYDIFCVNEIALFYRSLPFKEFCFTLKNILPEKLPNERLSIILCCNQLGSELLTPVVIGNEKVPTGIGNLDVKKLPLSWCCDGRSVVTSDIFSEWLKKLDQHFRSMNRYILLFVENCIAHTSNVGLKNIRLVVIPATENGSFQPFNLGITQLFKLNYRKYELKKVISCPDKNPEAVINSLDQLTACFFVGCSWDDILQESIKSSFRKAGFPSSLQCSEDQVPIDVIDDEFVQLMTLTSSFVAFSNPLKPEEFIMSDKDLAASEQFYDLSLDKKNLTQLSGSSEATSSHVHIDTDKNSTIKCMSDAIAAITNLKKFILGQNFPFSLLNSVLVTEKQLAEENFKQKLHKKQTLITDFFFKDSVPSTEYQIISTDFDH